MQINNVNSNEVTANVMQKQNPKLEEVTTKEATKENTGEVSTNEGKENIVKKEYSAISKDGDTVEISKDGSNKAGQEKIQITEDVVTGSSSKMSAAALAKCSPGKLKQLLSSGQISKQQYMKAIKAKAK